MRNRKQNKTLWITVTMDILLKGEENNYTYLAINKIKLAHTFSAGGGGLSGRRNVRQVRVERFEIIAA